MASYAYGNSQRITPSRCQSQQQQFLAGAIAAVVHDGASAAVHSALLELQMTISHASRRLAEAVR